MKALLASMLMLFIALHDKRSSSIPRSLSFLGDDTSNYIKAIIYPRIPLIEKDNNEQYLNFDFGLKNLSAHSLEITGLEVSLKNHSGMTILRKSLNENGQEPSIKLIVSSIIKAGETINIFNPFYDYPRALKIEKLCYTFFLDFADTQEEIIQNKRRLPLDFDLPVTILVLPHLYRLRTRLSLPLKDKFIVWDGHDFYSHHRRYLISLPKQHAQGITANSNRYAYDLISVDRNDNMYKGSPFKKENWFVFSKPVYAPGAGIVIESENNIPDNSYSGKTVFAPHSSNKADALGMGNYMIIDHKNNEFSTLLHMEKGSLRFKKGDKVKAGQQIGNVGFSGDAIYPHVHYTLMNGPTEQVSEGIPSYFHSYFQYQGKLKKRVEKGLIVTGVIVSAANE